MLALALSSALQLIAPAPLAHPPRAAAASDAPPGNILVVVLDDVSAFELGVYGLPGALAQTPTLDALAAEGVLFENVWSAPVCSPTRVSMLTGRYGFRTGIGQNVGKNGLTGPSLDEFLMPEALRRLADTPYATAAIGKWHIGNASTGGDLSPNLAGFPHYEGILYNLTNESYYDYSLTTNGATVGGVSTYATTQQVDAALEFIESASGPWYCHLAFSAPHEPWELPPAELYHTPINPPTFPVLRSLFIAMLEALDTELGRLLDALGPELRANTTVIVLGDNGTHGHVMPLVYDNLKAKGTMYEGGVHVPLLIAGPSVMLPGKREPALVHALDVYATVAELSGIDTSGAVAAGLLDSLSLLPYLRAGGSPPLREHLFTERFQPNGPGPYNLIEHAIRDARYKLIRRSNAPDELYDLLDDPKETADLLLGTPSAEAGQALLELGLALDALLAS